MQNPFTKSIIPDQLKNSYYSVVNPFIEMLIRMNANPNVFTFIGLVLGMFSGYFAARGMMLQTTLFLLLSGLCDSIDGTIARKSNRESRFGALLDSTLDRYSEMFVFFGLAYHFIQQQNYITSLALAIGLGGSLMVSYVRARSEALGFECKVGMMQRPERLILLSIGTLLYKIKFILILIIWFIAIMANVTAIHRIFHIYKQDGGSKNLAAK